jgi:hypothetical protein
MRSVQSSGQVIHISRSGAAVVIDDRRGTSAALAVDQARKLIALLDQSLALPDHATCEVGSVASVHGGGLHLTRTTAHLAIRDRRHEHSGWVLVFRDQVLALRDAVAAALGAESPAAV